MLLVFDPQNQAQSFPCSEPESSVNIHYTESLKLIIQLSPYFLFYCNRSYLLFLLQYGHFFLKLFFKIEV